MKQFRDGSTNGRYDVRATLSDVSQFEAPPGGYDNRLDYLSAAEQRAEQLCEEERYFSLYNNDFEEELYKGKAVHLLFNSWFKFNLRVISLFYFSIYCRGKAKKTGFRLWTSWI